MTTRRGTSTLHCETGSKALSGGMATRVQLAKEAAGNMSTQPGEPDKGTSCPKTEVETSSIKTTDRTVNLIAAPHRIRCSCALVCSFRAQNCARFGFVFQYK